MRPNRRAFKLSIPCEEGVIRFYGQTHDLLEESVLNILEEIHFGLELIRQDRPELINR